MKEPPLRYSCSPGWIIYATRRGRYRLLRDALIFAGRVSWISVSCIVYTPSKCVRYDASAVISTRWGGRERTSCAVVQRLACLLRKRITVACICIIVASNAHISSWISSPRVRACSPVFRWRKISWLAPSRTHGHICFKRRRSYRCIPHCIAAVSVVWIWFAVRSFTS